MYRPPRELAASRSVESAMVVRHTRAECLKRAEEQRALAEAATLAQVRDRHLASARKWEEIARGIHGKGDVPRIGMGDFNPPQ